MADTRCKRCHLEKDGHKHCGDCGARMAKGVTTKHQDGCPKAFKPRPDQQCPKCHRLLAAGAHCPEHGAPLSDEPEGELTTGGGWLKKPLPEDRLVEVVDPKKGG